MKHLAIAGGGSWGTALAIVLAPRFETVSLWVHDSSLAESIRKTRENALYLPGFRIPENVEIGPPPARSEILLGVMPARHARTVYGSLPVPAGIPIVSATKGLEAGTLLRMSEVIGEVLPGHPVAVLSGPTFAREIAAGEPAAIVIASAQVELATAVQTSFSTQRLRLYTNADTIGVELGAALKNVIAIGAGVVQGLGLGSNTRAALVTRGLAEITRLALAAGGQPATLAGLAGLGDLVLTCTGELSRNRHFGMELAKRRRIEEIAAETKMVAEGVGTAASALALAERWGVEMPIAVQIDRILRGNVSPAQAIQQLMERAPREE